MTAVKLKAQLEEARLQRAIEKEKAETEALAQRVLAESVDPRVLQLRQLEIQQILANAQLLAAKKWNGQQPQSVTLMGGDNKIPLFMTTPLGK